MDMSKKSSGKKSLSTKSLEMLWHFRWGYCGKWWSIGDAPVDKVIWWCPWCGKRNEYEKEIKLE
jgi:hypothetical protein